MFNYVIYSPMKYLCSACNAEFLKWSGKCSSCGEWGTLEEVEDVVDLKSTDSNKSVHASKYSSLVELSKQKKKK